MKHDSQPKFDVAFLRVVYLFYEILITTTRDRIFDFCYIYDHWIQIKLNAESVFTSHFPVKDSGLWWG
jgi:hypothetical protein